MSRALEGLLARGEEPHVGPQRVRRCFCHDQVCDVHGVERAPEQRPPCHAGQRVEGEGVDGVAGFALESAAAGHVRASPVAFG